MIKSLSSLPRVAAVFVASIIAVSAFSCGGSDNAAPPSAAAGLDATTIDDASSDATTDRAADGARIGCAVAGLSGAAWSAGPYGAHRGDLSADFRVPLSDGTTWGLKDHFDGCESYVFVTDRQLQSSTSTKTIWESDADLSALVRLSPPTCITSSSRCAGPMRLPPRT